MPVLRDPKREKFAQFCARGLSTVDAYERSGFKRNTGNAVTFRKRPDIQKRIEEIQLEMQMANEEELHAFLKDTGLNQTYIVRQLLETALAAKDAKRYDVASKVLKDIGAELFGMFTERKHLTIDEQSVTTTTTATINFEGLNQAIESLTGPSPKVIEIDGYADVTELTDERPISVNIKDD